MNKGLFKVELGSVTGFGPTVFSGKTLYLGMRIGTDPEMTPRLSMTSQAYAQLAKNAIDVKDRNIHPKSVSIGAQAVIDANGKWGGSPTGLRGPKGDTGATGDQGEPGLLYLVRGGPQCLGVLREGVQDPDEVVSQR